MRAVGTGTHPEGRFPKGQVCDLNEVDGKVHPDYQSLLDDGYLELLAPEDDPGRTTTQIANAIVRGDALTDPVDAKLADEISDEQALAITHTGDPDAPAELADPHVAAGTTLGNRGLQRHAAPLGARADAPYDEEVRPHSTRGKRATRAASAAGKRSGGGRARGRAAQRGATAPSPDTPGEAGKKPDDEKKS